MSPNKRSVHLAELAHMAGLTRDEADALDLGHNLPPHTGVDSEGRWWLVDEAEVWAETFRRLRASMGSLPALSFTAADISWVKLKRHVEECQRDRGPCGGSMLVGHGALPPPGCEKHARLYETYEKNRKAES